MDWFKRIITFIWERVARYALKFGVVGAIGFAVNVGVFNLLRVGTFGTGHFIQSPIGASLIAVTVSILFNWVGNRYWTFREHRRRNILLELLEYSVVSVGGMFFQVACLYVSHYVLGFTSLLADNISSNFVGIGLGTVFRFFLYRYWVYGHNRKDGFTVLNNEAAVAAVLVDDHSEVRSDVQHTGEHAIPARRVGDEPESELSASR